MKKIKISYILPALFAILSLGCFYQPVFAVPPTEGTTTTNTNSTTANNAAANGTNSNNAGKGLFFDGRDGDSCGLFLGLVSWDCNVNIGSSEETLTNGIWQIVTNVATDITIIASYLVIGYVIYGGYLYVFSGGEASKVAAGRKTLTRAFIGLAICMSAYIIMNTIRFALVGQASIADCATQGCVTSDQLFLNAISWAIGVVGIVSAIFVVYGGILYITSTGEPAKLQKAKQTILYALIGLAIVALAEVITAFVSNIIRTANSGTSYNDSIIISKE